MIAQRVQDAQLLLNVTSSIGTLLCYLHSPNGRRLRWRSNLSERCLSPASPGLASAHNITVVSVRIQLWVCASLTTSTPAWHFCLHKRHHRLSIRLSMTSNGRLLTGNFRSIQGPNTLDGTNLLVLSVFVSQFRSISGILKLEGIRHLPATGLMMSPQCLHCQHILPSLPDPT
jgi:hypothetical protein